MKADDFNLLIPKAIGEYIWERSVTYDIEGETIKKNALYDVWKSKEDGSVVAVKVEEK